MYELLATTVETHQSRNVRHITLSSCATDGKLQWKEHQQIRTSCFLFVSWSAAKTTAKGVHLTALCVPVAQALRALLKLVTSEPDAKIFCMAVADLSEISNKIVSSINCLAFGRAAIPDAVD
ncbi:hypothetical protein CCR75_006181 [Bremia lactucae]|uniref:Uncharacterized protein n=1 Tax=Bremia lactucae TaxID=4779 RepID=A0A976FQM7_BRELC|nr:hypothetical protein CCR75_006181 [Bremia lactucae]